MESQLIPGEDLADCQPPLASIVIHQIRNFIPGPTIHHVQPLELHKEVLLCVRPEPIGPEDVWHGGYSLASFEPLAVFCLE